MARNITFAPASGSAPAGAAITLTLDNQDTGVAHDIQVFNAAGGMLAATDIATGPNTRSVTFTPPGPGSYPFKCSVHPRQMFGTLVVR